MPRSGPGPAIGLPSTRDRALLDRQEAADQVEQGALAATARAEQRDKLAVADRERHVVERQYRPAARRPIDMADPLDRDLRRTAHRPTRRHRGHIKRRRPGAGRDPLIRGAASAKWIPALAGMTGFGFVFILRVLRVFVVNPETTFRRCVSWPPRSGRGRRIWARRRRVAGRRRVRPRRRSAFARSRSPAARRASGRSRWS